ncbi:MAG TPA: M48 family metalloprotease [Vicinamibacterales bacterium]|nr:M48 family metalloprotease [Vicinamibacterales bacterium]
MLVRATTKTWFLPGSCLCLILLAGCATNPVTGEREFSLMSEEQEIQLGREMDVQVREEMGVYDDRELQQYVETIGLRLARASERPNLPWHFAVVDAPAVNAFALPGGYIYITRGILPFLDNEAELAGVLGHEVGHVTARHAAQQYTKATSTSIGLTLLGIFVPEARPFQGLAQTAFSVLFLQHSREAEREADRLGVNYAAATGWDPAGVSGMLTTLARLDEAAGSRKGVPNWLATHPAPAERVEDLQVSLRELGAKVTGTPVVNQAEFLRRIAGIVYGDSPSEGIVRDNRFMHPELRLALTFPPGWEVQNTRTQVLSKAPERDHYLLLQIVQNARGSVEQVAQATMGQAGFRQLSGERSSLNGLDAYVGTYDGVVEGLGRVGTLAAHVLHDGRIYMIAGIAPAGEFQQAQRDFAGTIRSFQALSAAEAARIRPNRIDLHTVRAGDTWASLAERSAGAIKPSTLAIMNDSDPGQPPRVGVRVKIVVES